MDHHRQNHHHHHQPRLHHQPRQQPHHHHQPRQQQHHHHHPHIMNSPPPPPPPSSSRYLPLHPPPPRPPPPPTFPENHPNLFQQHQPHHPPPTLSPPFHPNFTFINSPPHPHPNHHPHLHHHRDDDHHHRDLIFRSPPRVPPPNRLHPFDDNPNFPDDVVVDRPRFRLNELPQPPPPPPPPQQQHPRVSPVARRSPNQFVQFDRFGRQFDSPPPPPSHPPRFREDLNLQHNDSIDYQLRRDRVEDDRRIMGVVDRLEGDFDRDWDRNRDHDRGRDHHERYYPEMALRNEFELNTGNTEYVNDEVLMRGGRRDNVGGFEENVNKRYGGSGGGGGAREVSRSPIKFRIGGVEVDDRFSNRGRKEDVQEYNVNNRGTPRKILQKKSAFLRIQQPGKPQHHTSSNGSSSFRNRFDNSTATPSPHKGKESNSEFVDTRIGEERVGSPVELDVSFKSNALVAKAIMAAPSSSSGVDVNVSNAVSDSGTRVVSESQAKVESLKKKAVAVSKRVVKDSKSGARVSPIMKRVGKPNNVEIRGSESSPGGSSSLSGGITRKAAPKGKVLGKVHKNAGIDKVSSPTIRKKRKATSLLSQLSNPMSTSSKTASGLVNVASSATHPSDDSMPSDASEKQLAKELSLGGIVVGSTQNDNVDMGKVDINESPTVIGQEEIVGELDYEAPVPTVIGQEENVGELDSEAPAPKKVRKEAILEPLPDSTGSLGSGVSKDHGDAKGYSQDEQRISNPDQDVSKSLGKCSSDINSVKDSVKDQDVAAVLVDNCSVEGSSELVRVHMVENVDNNDVCSGNVDTLDSVAVMSFISNPIKTEMDLLCPMVDADEPCETQVLSSPENATIGLSLGGLYSDRNDEPGLRYSEDNSKLGRFSNDANKHSETQAFSSPEIATIGLSLGGLYADRNFESDLGHSDDNAKLGSFSNDVSVDKRILLDCDDDVSIGLTNSNTVSDVRVTNDVQEQQYPGSDMSGNDDTTLEREEAPKTCIYAAGTLPFSVKEDSTVLNRKRKVGTEPDSLDSRMPECCHESLVSLSFPVVNAMLPVEKCSSAASGPPCVEPNVSKEIEYTGSCVEGMNSLNHICDPDQIEYTSNCGKKRKNLPVSSVFSDAPGSESSDLPAASVTLLPVADGPSANHFPQSAEGFELHKSVITGEDVTGGASSSFGAATCSVGDNSKSDFVCKDSCLPVTESAPPDAEQSYLPEPGCNQKIGENLMTAKANDENGFIVLESACRLATCDGNIDLRCLSADHTENVDQGPLATNVESDDNGMIANDGNSGLPCSSADHTGDVDQGPLAMNMECDDSGMATNDGNSDLLCLSVDDTGNEVQRSLAVNMECDDNIALNANLSSSPGCPHSCVESSYVGVTTYSDMLDTSNVVLPGDCSRSSPTLDISNASPAINVISGEKLSMDDDKSKQSSSTQSSFSAQANLLPESHKNNPKPGISASLAVQPFTQKSVSLPSKNVKTTMASSNSFTKLRKNVLTRSEATPSTSINPSNKTHTYPAKPRTWLRTNNSATPNIPVKKPLVGTLPPHRPPYGKAMKAQDTSYIRKGNSLVRNPTSGASSSGSRALGASIDQSKPNDTYRTRKLVGSVTESTELPDGSVTGGRSTPIEMPKTPPLSCSGKTSDNDVVCSGECTSSVHVDQSEGADNEEAMNSSELNILRDSESVGNRNLEDPGIFSDGDLLGSSSKKMVYIKRKSNQLIAASKSSQLSVQNMGRTAASYSDNYYKRRKNQLIRASSDGNIQQMVEVIKDNSRSLSQRASHVYTDRSSTKRPSNKGKSPKFSLVWKLGDSKAAGKGVDALRSRRLLSLLLPWKRATYWSRKQLSSRKRGAVYVRSGRGFSLRRSKVISLPGTSLKWSKSMEKRSKKVEEEAAQAVAVQKSGSSGVSSKAASSIHSLHKVVHSLKLHPGERIFRIGVFRYRMDSSRKTLQRISDEEASEVTASETEKDARKTYVPKRLLIGSDEYVRIGNGNQLVRDPKRRTRILASEKVRWSLHTARMRLAKKRKFCQFFTRFGKCNKGEGKCPFIHDPSKIAVCTKFLNGLCVDPNCKLTHKVIPERMPDCSFYLQGLCSNEKCPYRHVNVNPKASICENFLRGYCAEGNECRKKHSYICPEFEACGSCPQGSKCKLYHPKKVKSKKRKVSRDQNNAKGRYFGSDLSVAVEPETRPLVEKHVESSEGTFSVHGDLGDFISLDVDVDVDDVEARENGLTSEQAFLPEDDPLNSQLDGLDELIKPLSIMGTL